MAIKQEEDAPVEVQLTPLIDCVFLLLIFFLVSSQLKKVEKRLEVDLPRAHVVKTYTTHMPRIQLAHAPQELGEAAHMVDVGVRNENRLHFRQIQPKQMARMAARFACVKPIQAAIDIQRPRNMVPTRHWLRPRTCAKQVYFHRILLEF